MTFSIQAIKKTGKKFEGEIILGEYRESFPLITTRWSVNEYRSQWMDALNNFVQKKFRACILIVDIQPLSASSGISYWAMFRDKTNVHFQQRFSRDLVQALIGPPETIMSVLPPRKQGSPSEQEQVSEWTLPLSDIRYFVKKTQDSSTE